MRKENEYKSEESRQREQSHWFGAPNGNTPYSLTEARNQRSFYRWCETQATEAELKEYVKNVENPIVRRRFVKALLKCNNVTDYFAMTNQTQGLPRQEITLSAPEQIKIEFE